MLARVIFFSSVVVAVGSGRRESVNKQVSLHPDLRDVRALNLRRYLSDKKIVGVDLDP